MRTIHGYIPWHVIIMEALCHIEDEDDMGIHRDQVPGLEVNIDFEVGNDDEGIIEATINVGPHRGDQGLHCNFAPFTDNVRLL